CVVSFHLVQSYSTLFNLDIHVVSDSTGLKAADLLEQNVTLTVWQRRTPQRHITGLFRHFQQQDIESIVAHLLEDNQVIRASYLLKERHPAREFCVQYGENDWRKSDHYR
ncbi:type VI secretion system tip protein VgrG, partial [Salmonella enterica subsp. salamae]|nr:type VI secretion system tip protein VgrG [Salmonella enterica]ECC1628846.1 type VI secretion system tip protein VgrG [Salmonella enterica subsp. salamae]